MNIEHTMDLLKAANPVPDETVVDEPHESSTAYLTALERRSEEIRRPEENDSDPPAQWDPRRVIAIAVAAAALVAAIGYGLVSLLGPGNDVIDGSEIDLNDLQTLLPGTWESVYGDFEFTRDGTYAVTAEGTVIERGTYRNTVPWLVALVADVESPQCAGETDVLRVTAESADALAVEWESVGCEAHFTLDCSLPGGGGQGCGRMVRIED